MFGIDLPAGLRRLVAGYIDTVALGLRAFCSGAHANAPTSRAAALLRDLARLLRLALLILACQLDLAPRPRRALRTPATASWRPPTMRFPLFPAYSIRDGDAPRQTPPPQFHAAPRDPVLTLTRRLATLAHVLAHPGPVIRRMARRLGTRLMVIGPRPPRRAPSAQRREVLDELLGAHAEAWHHLHEFRRRRRDIASLPASAT